MNKNIGIIIGIIIIAAIGLVLYSSMMPNEDAMMKDEMMRGADSMMKDEDKMMIGEEAMMKKDETSMMEGEAMMKAGSYVAYSPEKVMLASATNDVVLFFRAGWCPSCRTLDTDIKNNLSKIPSNLTILDVDYDNSTELKKKYGVTYQHTFVQVDKDGNLIKKWSGGSTLSSVLKEVQ